MESEITKFDAERIIDALRTGIVPPVHLEQLCVGREPWLNSISHDLQFVAKGASKVRFVSAPWGGGKTHFLQVTREHALKCGLAVSHVELNSREAPLDRFEIIFPKVIRGIIFPDNQNLESVLDKWAVTFPYYTAEEIGSELRKLSPSLDFRSALRACLAFAKGETEMHRGILRNVAGWLGGDSLNSELKKFGVYNPVKITNVTEIFNSFLHFILHEGYKGLAIILDEAEAVTSLTQSARRNEANQNIRKLLDNADEHVGLYIIFATTPLFLTDSVRGAKSYPALWSRIHQIVSSGLESVSKRSIIISLEPLELNELEKLTNKIIKLHSECYEWCAENYINIGNIRSLISKFLKESKNRTIRAFIRSLIYMLDRLEESKDSKTVDSLIGKLTFDES